MSIFASIKRLFQHSAVYGIGHILSRSIVFLLMPLHTNLFPKAEMGVSGLLFAYLGIFTIVYTYGLDTAFFRFYILAEKEEEKKRVFTTAYFTIILSSILFTGLIILNANWIAVHLFGADIQKLSVDLALLVKLAGGILFFDALCFMPFLTLRAEERPAHFAIFKLINVVINVVANIVLIIKLKFGIEGIFIANFIASLSTFVILLPIGIRRFKMNYSLPTLKELMAFGIPYLPSTICVALMDTVDRIFLEHLADVEAVGIYSQGHKLGMFMALFVTAFRFAWHPFFLSTVKQENAKAIFQKVFTYILLACSMVFLLFSFFLQEIVTFRIGNFTILGAEYLPATTVVPVIFLAYMFYAAYLNFLIGIYLEKKTKYLPWITFAGMSANIIVNLTLIPVMGMMGSAIARVAAYVVMAFTLYQVEKKLYHVQYEWGRVIKMLLIMATFFAIFQWDVIQFNALYKLLLFLAYIPILRLTGFFQKSELATLRNMLGKKSA